MKRFVITCSLTLFSLLTHGLDDEVVPDSCETAEQCVRKIYDVVDYNDTPGTYPSRPVQAIIKKLISFDDNGIPFILDLLEDHNLVIARVGAVALRQLDSIDEKYLPKIVAGLDRGVSWLPPALARVGSPEAAEIAMITYLNSQSAPHNQEAYAIKLFGKRIIPYVIKAIDCEYKCNDELHRLLGSVLGDMNENDRIEVAKQLIVVAQDLSRTLDQRNGALIVISFLGEAAAFIEPKILYLREKQHDMVYAANHALIGIK